MTLSKRELTRDLNDRFRRTFSGGLVTFTTGIAARRDRNEIIAKVGTFDAFSFDNDPHGEHDFGAFEHAGERIFWKIDYYDSTLRFSSCDPSDPVVTVRVLTILLAGEY